MTVRNFADVLMRGATQCVQSLASNVTVAPFFVTLMREDGESVHLHACISTHTQTVQDTHQVIIFSFSSFSDGESKPTNKILFLLQSHGRKRLAAPDGVSSDFPRQSPAPPLVPPPPLLPSASDSLPLLPVRLKSEIEIPER